MTTLSAPLRFQDRTLSEIIAEANDLICYVIEPLTTDGINKYLEQHYPDWSDNDRDALLQIAAAMASNVAWAYDEARRELTAAMDAAAADLPRHFNCMAKAIGRRRVTTATRQRRRTIADLKIAMSKAAGGDLQPDGGSAS